MQTSRRTFLQYISIMGLTSLSGFSLFAKETHFNVDNIGSIHMDEYFDPDEWL